MIDDPTYNGCANQRYGPDTVTSRDLCRWPAAQKRTASPQAEIAIPAASDPRVGVASTSTSAPETKPSATRKRASVATRASRIGRARPRNPSDTPGSATRLHGREPPLNGIPHFGHFHVEEAHAR